MVDPWTMFWVVTTFGLYIIIAIRARAGSTEDFYVAGHDVHPVINGMATGADWMSAASFLSMAGLIAFLGYCGAVRRVARRYWLCVYVAVYSCRFRGLLSDAAAAAGYPRPCAGYSNPRNAPYSRGRGSGYAARTGNNIALETRNG